MSTLSPTSVRTSDPARFAAHLEVHHQIDGWFSVESAAAWDALLCFQERCNVAGHMLEIGVWRGKSAALMAVHVDPKAEVCVLVDKYLQLDPIKEALRQVRPELDESFKFVRADSRRLLVDQLVTGGFEAFRWIHIDGEHSSRAVMSDLLIAETLLAPDGVVCVDDFFNWLYPQVTEGVLRYVRENPDDFSLFLCGYNKAYLARPHRVHELLAFCKDQLVGELEARDVEATLAKTTYPAEMNTFGMGPRFEGARLRGPDWEQKTIRV